MVGPEDLLIKLGNVSILKATLRAVRPLTYK